MTSKYNVSPNSTTTITFEIRRISESLAVSINYKIFMCTLSTLNYNLTTCNDCECHLL